jgi:hypothetical protein
MSHPSDDLWEDELIEVKPPLLGKSKVLWTSHALRQMNIRDITKLQAINVIRNPHEFLDADMGRVRARRIRAGGLTAIDVVYELDLDQVVVITAIVKQLQRKK